MNRSTNTSSSDLETGRRAAFTVPVSEQGLASPVTPADGSVQETLRAPKTRRLLVLNSCLSRSLAIVLPALLLLLALPAKGQETPKGELFAGYSYYGADLGGVGQSLHGANFSVAETANNWVGGVIDVSAHWGAGQNVTSVMGGPVFYYRKSPTTTPFFHVLVGAVRGSSQFLGISKSDSELGFAAGGGLDVKLSKSWAFRVIQADYITSDFGTSWQSNVRLSAGVVLRLGAR